MKQVIEVVFVSALVCFFMVMSVSPSLAAKNETGGVSEKACVKGKGTAEEPAGNAPNGWYACCHKISPPVNGNTKICSSCSKDGKSCSTFPFYRAKVIDPGETPDDPSDYTSGNNTGESDQETFAAMRFKAGGSQDRCSGEGGCGRCAKVIKGGTFEKCECAVKNKPGATCNHELRAIPSMILIE